MTTSSSSPNPSERVPVQDYTGLAPTYDAERYVTEEHIGHEERRRLVLERLLPGGVGRAADIACGTGRGLATLRQVARVVVGVDGTLAMLGEARRKFGSAAALAQANASSLPFKDGTFDLVICLNFLHLFDSLEAKRAFVTEMGRVLAPGGVLVVEFDNACQGVILGGLRKYFGRDIGYDWPWTIRRAFRDDAFEISRVSGANLPFVWRLPLLRRLDAYTDRFPLNYLATRIMVRAVKRT
jgi:ubiquinone/menaquinone biosynthesis C-methylase UbiE